MSKNSVICVRVDKWGLELAKQVFASVHYNASWQGDLLLLAHRITESDLSWFRKRGILVKKCKPLYSVGKWPEYSASKLYIFTKEMKRWDRVILLDADIIVRASLDRLTKINGFAAASEIDEQLLISQFNLESYKDWQALKKIEAKINKKIDLTKPAFNGGVLVFNTDIIHKNTFNELEKLLETISKIAAFADQTALNLYFYDEWNKLPRIYNLHPLLYMNAYHVKPEKIRGINLHFAGFEPKGKPFHPQNPFHKEWSRNLKKAESLDRKTIPPPKEAWSNYQIWFNEKYLALKRFKHSPFDLLLQKLLVGLKIQERF